MLGETLLSKGLVPDFVVRAKIRSLLRQRLDQLGKLQTSDQEHFIQSMCKSPIAVHTERANDQHYEVPAEFFVRALGPNLKYSCAFFEPGDTLGLAEARMLQITCERAQLTDGQRILELGCGWGSLTLWMAAHYPQSQITAVSNSNSQREYIEAQAASRGLTNIKILTRDMNQLELTERFDRVVSVEMFEHMRNVSALVSKISKWLVEDGKLFVHIFTHRDRAYLFEEKDESDWMGRYFFSGGMMPSHNLYRSLDMPLKIEQEWIVSGLHYAATAECWLKNMDAHATEIRTLFAKTYGPSQANLWFARWRVFFMSCAELWAFNNGSEWQVSHYRFSRARHS